MNLFAGHDSYPGKLLIHLEILNAFAFSVCVCISLHLYYFIK